MHQNYNIAFMSNQTFSKTSVTLPAKVHQRLKIEAAKSLTGEKLTISQIIEKAVRQYLGIKN